MTFFDSKECEWSDQELFLNGVKIAKIRAIKLKKAVEKEHLYASGNKAISIQQGNQKVEGTLTVLKGALEDINRTVIGVGGEDVMDAEFVLVCNYRAKGTRNLASYTLTALQFTEFEVGMAQGEKFQEVALPFLALDLKLV